MGYMSLLDISLNVDYSELEGKLERIDNNVEILTDKVKDIENDGMGFDEDKVNEAIEAYLSNETYQTESDVETLVSNELDNRGFLTPDEVDEAIDQKLRDDLSDALDNSQRFSDHESSLQELENQVGTLANTVDALQGAVDALTERLNEQAENNETAMTFFGLIKQAFALLQR